MPSETPPGGMGRTIYTLVISMLIGWLSLAVTSNVSEVHQHSVKISTMEEHNSDIEKRLDGDIAEIRAALARIESRLDK